MAQPDRRIGERSDGTAHLPAAELGHFTEFLVAARRRAGCSLDQIALVTKVPARHLEALEQGRVDDLPRGVYRRAIIRTYATAVGLDPSLVLERFGQVFGAETAFSEWQTVPPPSRPRPATTTTPSARVPPEGPATLVSSRRAVAPPQVSPGVRDFESRRTRLILGAAVTAVMLLIAGYLLFTPARTSSSAATAAPVSETATRSADPLPAVDRGGPSTGPAGNDAVRRIADTATSQPPSQDTAPVEPEEIGISNTPVVSQLVVTTNPAGARVTVDGIGWGLTPITIRHLSPGVKVLRVTMDGYVSQEREVRIGEDGIAAARITLQPRN